MYKNWQIYVDMNCQQVRKISRKKTTEVKIFQKVLGWATFLKHPVGYGSLKVIGNGAY